MSRPGEHGSGIEAPPGTLRAVFELAPAGSAALVARRVADAGDAGERGGVVEERDGRAVLELPAGNWGRSPSLLVAAIVAGEAMELGALERCRLVELQLPDGLLPGPRFGADLAPGDGRCAAVGLIVKPALGLSARGVAACARAAIAGGAVLVKDDEVLGDPPWCRLTERVRAVAEVLDGRVVYCPNVTGAHDTLLARAQQAVELGANGLMISPFAQGLDALLALRDADLGVPIYAHRAGSGPLARNERFGASGAVLATLTRACGADYVVAGGFGGSLFDTPDDVRRNLAAIRGPCGGARPSIPVVGGGAGPQTVVEQARGAAGRPAPLVMLGTRAYRHPDGLEGGVRAAVRALAGTDAG